MNSDYTLMPTNTTLYSATMRLDANPIRTALKMCALISVSFQFLKKELVLCNRFCLWNVGATI